MPGFDNLLHRSMERFRQPGAYPFDHFPLREDAAVLLSPFRAPEQLLKQHGFLLPGQIKMFQYLLRPPPDQNLSHIKHDVSNQCDPSPVLSI